MKILIHRKDNIGDAVLSLPLIQVLRRHWPSALIDYWGPSYVTPAMAWCHALSRVKSYTKLKHSKSFLGRLVSTFFRIAQLFVLRLENYDLMIYVGNGSTLYAIRTIKFIAPKRAMAFTTTAASLANGIQLIHSPESYRRAEYLEILELAKALKIPEPHHWSVPLLQPPTSGNLSRSVFEGAKSAHPVIGVHLSARRPAQLWPIKRFEALINLLLIQFSGARILVTWSPGRKDDSLHPGDDERANELARLLSSKPIAQRVKFMVTSTLVELLTVQSGCDVIFCSDGGAMHLAAAVGKRVVAMFGDSDPVRWCPIGDDHRVITTISHDVREIDVNRAMTEICIALGDDRS